MAVTLCLMCGEPLKPSRHQRQWAHHNMTVEQIDHHGKIYLNDEIDDHHLNNPYIPKTWQTTW